MESHALRDRACELAPTDWSEAAIIARQIEDPWYACQAIAWCGRFAPTDKVQEFIEEAFRRAESCRDAYQQFAATAWPLRALVELGQHDRAMQEFDRVAQLSPSVRPPSSRAVSCFLVFQAIAGTDREFEMRVLRWLLASCRPVEHWRQRLVVRDAIIQAVSMKLIERADALQMVDHEKASRKIALCLDRGEISRPRAFFWTHWTQRTPATPDVNS